MACGGAMSVPPERSCGTRSYSPVVTAISELVAALAPERVLTDSDVTDAYARDRTFLEPGRPLAVVLAHTRDDVVAVMRWATRHRVPVVPRGAGTGLAGGATAIEGCVVLALHRMAAIRNSPRRRDRRGRAWGHHRRPGPGRPRARADVRPRPLLLRDLHHRRQPGDQRGRPAVREVRRDPRLGTRPGGRARGRAGDQHRQAHREGRDGVRPDRPVRRLRGDARDHHRGDGAAAQSAVGLPGDDRGRVRLLRRRPPPSPRSSRPGASRPCWSCSTGTRSRPSTTGGTSGWRSRPGRC